MHGHSLTQGTVFSRDGGTADDSSSIGSGLILPSVVSSSSPTGQLQRPDVSLFEDITGGQHAHRMGRTTRLQSWASQGSIDELHRAASSVREASGEADSPQVGTTDPSDLGT